jgi:uncharacterized protein
MDITHTLIVVWAGFVIGAIFGVVGQRIEFCITGGLREWWRDNAPRRAAAFTLAVAVAIAGTQIVVAFDYVELRESLYLQPSFSWLVIPVGGFLFGLGMMLARGCGSRALVLLGDGNLRSLVVLLCLGISAYVALTGLLAPPRLWLVEATTMTPELAAPSVPALFESWGLGPGLATALPTIVLAVGLAAFALIKLGLYRAPRDIAGAVVIGLLVPAGWVATGYFGADDFDPVRLESLTFVAPVGDSIQYLMLSTGTTLGFGVTVVAGVILGSLAASLISRDFELRGFESPRHMVSGVGGGILMGVGGALALGCSIGQGLSGVSTLAIPSFLAAAGILAGALTALALAGKGQVAKKPQAGERL